MSPIFLPRHESIPRTLSVPQLSVEVIRVVGVNGLDIDLIIHLAKTFTQKVCSLIFVQCLTNCVVFICTKSHLSISLPVINNNEHLYSVQWPDKIMKGLRKNEKIVNRRMKIVSHHMPCKKMYMMLLCYTYYISYNETSILVLFITFIRD